MKILIVTDLHWPTINGVATFSRNIARGMAERGHKVHVIAPSQTGKKGEEIDGNYTIHRTASVPFPFYQNLRISLNPSREVKKIIDDITPDVVHIQTPLLIGQFAMRHAKKNHIPVMVTNHAMPENLMDNLKLLAPVSRPINYILIEIGARFYFKADVITMPTQSAIDMFKKADKTNVPTYPISNGVDLSRFTEGRASDDIYDKFSIPRDKKIVSYLGRLDGEKHLSVLIRAFDRIKGKVPDAHLLIVGGGTDEEHLKRLVYQYQLGDRTTFTGRVSDDDMEQLHRVGMVYVMPSPAELQSIATLEAMASGKPIVAVDAGALNELCISGHNGYLCEVDDDEEIADALLTILTNDTKRAAFGVESLKIAAEHDIRTTFDRFESIYSDLVKQQK